MSPEDPEFAQLVAEHRAALTARMAPSQVVTRAGTMLRLVKQGLSDMQEVNQDRILLGFLGIVVFGRSMTLVMQNLRTYARDEFDDWYAPWQKEMRSDPLLLYFSDLRTKVIHHDAPAIGVLVATSDKHGPPVGSVSIDDMPLPESHLGQPIAGKSMVGLCRLYAAYLERVFEAFAPVAFGVQDRLLATTQQTQEGPSGAA